MSSSPSLFQFTPPPSSRPVQIEDTSTSEPPESGGESLSPRHERFTREEGAGMQCPDSFKFSLTQHPSLPLLLHARIRYSSSLQPAQLKKKIVFFYADRLLIARKTMRRHIAENELFYSEYSLRAEMPSAQLLLYNGDIVHRFVAESEASQAAMVKRLHDSMEKLFQIRPDIRAFSLPSLRESFLGICGIVHSISNIAAAFSAEQKLDPLSPSLLSVLKRFFQLPSPPIAWHHALPLRSFLHHQLNFLPPDPALPHKPERKPGAVSEPLSPSSPELYEDVQQPRELICAAPMSLPEFFRLYSLVIQGALPPATVGKWISLFRFFLVNSPIPHLSILSPALDVTKQARTLLDYLVAHHLDPHNLLLGRKLSLLAVSSSSRSSNALSSERSASHQLDRLIASSTKMTQSCLALNSPPLSPSSPRSRRLSPSSPSSPLPFFPANSSRNHSRNHSRNSASSEDGSSFDLEELSPGSAEEAQQQLLRLTKLIASWSAIQDDADLLTAARSLADDLRVWSLQRSLSPGTLVILTLPGSEPVFARVCNPLAESESPDGGAARLEVTVDPFEQSAIFVAEDSVSFPSAEIMDMLQSSRHMLLCPEPLEAIESALQQRLDQALHCFLTDNLKLNTEIVQALLTQHKPNLNSFYDVEKICTELQRFLLSDSDVNEWIRATTQELTAFTNERLEQLDASQIYFPDLDKNMKSVRDLLAACPIRLLNRIKALKNSSELTLSRIEATRESIISGAQKRIITEKWLQMIDVSVITFLMGRGFSPDSVPSDYISQPPEDILVIQAQHHLLQQILDPSADLYGLRAFVASLATQIRAIIDEYIVDMVSVLVSDLHIADLPEIDPSGDPILLPTIQRYIDRFKTAISTFSPEAPPPDPDCCAKYAALIDDLEYLHEMLVIESELHTAPSTAKRLAISSVVPVSGLIMSKFHIIEQELATILEVWKASPKLPPASQPESVPQLLPPEPSTVFSWPIRMSFALPRLSSSQPRPNTSRSFLSSQRLVAPLRRAVPPSATMGVAPSPPITPPSSIRRPRTFNVDVEHLSDLTFLREALSTSTFELDEQLLQSLITLGLNVNHCDAQGSSLLITSSRSGSLRSVYSLIQAHVETKLLNAAGDSAFHLLVSRTFPHESSQNSSDMNPFLASILTKLVASCGIDFPSGAGNTPLHACVMGDCFMPILTVLLRLGANPALENHDEESPLYIAIKRNLSSAIMLFLLHGAPVTRKSFDAAEDPETRRLLQLKISIS